MPEMVMALLSGDKRAGKDDVCHCIECRELCIECRELCIECREAELREVLPECREGNLTRFQNG